jgi:Tol biopolymer transport system component
VLFSREGEPWWRKGYHGSQASQIWMVDLGSKAPVKLIAGDRSARWPLWRPDGKGFYYVGSQGGAANLRMTGTKKDTSSRSSTTATIRSSFRASPATARPSPSLLTCTFTASAARISPRD